MKYIIDANNLAGKLNLLDEKDFDKKLLEILKDFFKGKKIEVYLVFDSADTMGDKYKDGIFNVIYTPRDNFYNGADDMIIEIINKDISKAMVLVTDDLELISKIEDIEAAAGISIKKIKSTYFAEKVYAKIDKYDIITHELSDKEKDEITVEFLKIWK